MTFGKRLMGALAALATLVSLGVAASTAEAAQGCRVTSADGNVSATKEIKSVRSPGTVTVDNTVLCPTNLPTVQVNYTDGTSAQAPVTWLFDTPWNAQRGAHSVTATGFLVDAGSNSGEFDNQLSLNVAVKAATFRAYGYASTITTNVGEDPIVQLKKFFGTATSILWSNEESPTPGSYPITWNPVDPSQYAQAGSFDVTGYVEVDGIRSEPVTCKVVVQGNATTEKTITSVQTPDPVTVDSTVERPALNLPNTVTVTYSDGSTGDASITYWDWPADWNEGHAEHTVDVKGRLSTDSRVNPNNLTANLKVTVRAATLKAWVRTSNLYTDVGADPTKDLDATASAQWSNEEDSRSGYKVTWEKIDPSQYASAGTFVVKGHITVDGVKAEVSCTITVQGAADTDIISVADAKPVTVDSTVTYPQLNTLRPTVKVTYGNGSTGDVAVKWILPPDWNADRAQHTVEAKGILQAETSKEAKLEVTVRAATVTAGANTSVVYGHVGQDPTTMLQSVAIGWMQWSNEETLTDNLPITWDPIDPGQYSQAGSFTVHGTVERDGVKADVTCTVNMSAITDVQVVTKSVIVDTAKDDAPKPTLPIQVKVTYADGETNIVTPTWTVPDGWNHPNAAHKVKVTARTPGWDKDITTEITVQAARAESVAPLDGVSTQVGKKPMLPPTAEVTWSNGDVTDETVKWDSVDPADYAKTGDFTVNGIVADSRVSVKVAVLAATITGVENPSDVTTPSGTAPALPKSVNATWDNGNSSPVAVVWDKIDPAHYRKREGGDFTVKGTVAGWNDKVTVTVHVTPATVTNVEQPKSVTVFEGKESTIEIPKTVTVSWSNGDTEQVGIAWAKNNDPTKATFKAGDYIFKGTAEGRKVEWKVMVTAVKAESAELSRGKVETIATHAPDLSGITATVHYNDGTQTTGHKVDWPAIDKSQYAQANEDGFDVVGTVVGTDMKVSVHVVVKARVITAVVPEDKSIIEPTAKDGEARPKISVKATITWNDGTNETRDVSLTLPDGWNHPREKHTVVATGTVDGWDKPVTHQVTVEAATAESAANPATVTTQVKVKPVLPATVQVTWSNGETSAEPVTWDAIENSAYAEAGATFAVKGSVEGLKGKVTVTVKVVAATITGVENPAALTTESGMAPALPGTVKATWSNNEITDVTVAWGTIDIAKYMDRNGGDFTVDGKVAGWDGVVTVKVHVNPAKVLSATVKGDTELVVESGTAPKLPVNAKVTWSNGETIDEPITWDAFDGYKNREGGEFTVRGTVEGLQVQAQVTVNKATVTDVEQRFAVSTAVGEAPKLPGTVKVVWSNGDVTYEAAMWNTIDADDYAKAGTFEVLGAATVEGLSHGLIATVVVKETAKPNPTPGQGGNGGNGQNGVNNRSKPQGVKPGKLGATGASVAVLAFATMLLIVLAGCLMVALRRQ